jgi:hypothetical protein
MWPDYITPVYHHTKNFMVIIDQEYWKNKHPVLPDDALIWFTVDLGLTQGQVFMTKDQREALVSLWTNMPWVFKPKCTILQCACENISGSLFFLRARPHLRHSAAKK